MPAERPNLAAAPDAVTPRPGQSLAALAAAEAPAASSSAAVVAIAGAVGGPENVGDIEVPVFVQAFATDSARHTVGFASPTALPHPIVWSDLEAEPASQPPPEVDALAPWQVSTGLLPPDREAAREQSWQAWVEGWLTPKSIAVLATGSILLCVFAFLILPRLVQRPTLAITRSVQGAEAPPPDMAAVEAAAAPAANALVVYVSPPNAQIVVDGVLVRGNPYRGQFARGGIHLVKAFAPGYEPRVEQAHMSGDVVINLSLERSARFAARPAFGRAPRTRLAPGSPTRSVSGGFPSAGGPIPGALVDPHGGRAPLHPIVTTSPYDSQ
jgi:hypothetical protein